MPIGCLRFTWGIPRRSGWLRLPSEFDTVLRNGSRRVEAESHFHVSPHSIVYTVTTRVRLLKCLHHRLGLPLTTPFSPCLPDHLPIRLLPLRRLCPPSLLRLPLAVHHPPNQQPRSHRSSRPGQTSLWCVLLLLERQQLRSFASVLPLRPILSSFADPVCRLHSRRSIRGGLRRDETARARAVSAEDGEPPCLTARSGSQAVPRERHIEHGGELS